MSPKQNACGGKTEEKGFALVFSLIMLTLLVMVSLSVAAVSITDTKPTRDSSLSINTFQIANSGVERAFEWIYKHNYRTLNELVAANAGITCSNGILHGTDSSGTYDLTLYTVDVATGTVYTAVTDCNTPPGWRENLGKIHSVATYGNAMRAIDAGVAPFCSQGSAYHDSDPGTTYTTVSIGNQCWLKQNMQVGNIIQYPTGQNPSNLERYCYGNTTTPCPDTSLYTWDEAMQGKTDSASRGICPGGFHIPTDDEWYSLEQYLRTGANSCSNTRTSGDCSPAGTTLQGSGTGAFAGFLVGEFDSTATPLPVYADGQDKPSGSRKAYFWSSSSDSGSKYWYRGLSDDSSADQVVRNSIDKGNALSVRCIKDH